MDHSSSSSDKKTDEGNVSTLTDQIVFKSTNKNHRHSPKNNRSKSNNLSQQQVSSSLKADANLSFRTKDGKKHEEVDEIEKLCSRVSEVLKSHEINQQPKGGKEVVDYKKVFFKKNEKELEVFETEREANNNLSLYSSSESEDSEDFVLNQSHHKAKSLSKVICTLSKIENGCATFVSKDDLIFVLPSFFIPKNLNIGNTYMFKLNELDQANNKVSRVNTIHKFYSQDQNE